MGPLTSGVTMATAEDSKALTCDVVSPGSEDVEVGGQKVVRTVFEQTPRMSTYLLAFIVSEFGNITNTVGNVTVSKAPAWWWLT